MRGRRREGILKACGGDGRIRRLLSSRAEVKRRSEIGMRLRVRSEGGLR